MLVLFGLGVAGPDLLLIERSAGSRTHSGQSAFPGGAVEPEDADPQRAALREAQEETGLDPAGVVPLAVLPALWLAPSGFMVVPVLGWWRDPVAVRVGDPAEVARVERVPIVELADPANRWQVRHPTGFVSPGFAVRGMLVWGFTGRLVAELLRLGGWERPWNASRIRPLPGADDCARPGRLES